ncbi:unnamed protein product [Rotaria sp. Silwood1]|nr:unnamed protein product [Rotaria sp. Silwood1]
MKATIIKTQPLIIIELTYFHCLVKMRPAYAGPGSAGSRWKPTQDPGKLAGTSNSGGNRTSGTDANSASKGGNVQHGSGGEKKE